MNHVGIRLGGKEGGEGGGRVRVGGGRGGEEEGGRWGGDREGYAL